MRNKRFKLLAMISGWITVSAMIVLSLIAVNANAQSAGTANISGVVTDATGALIQNATVTATDPATQARHTATTGSTGLYSFPNLPIGSYIVEAAAPGFKHYRQTEIKLEVGSSIAVNISMKIGGADQTVQVEAAALALQTEDSSLKQTVDQNTLTEMPLNGRQMTSLITLTGGAVNANENNDESGSKTFYSSAVISVGGGQGNALDYRLDGADHNDYMTNVNLPFPFPDAVAEFSVETAALGAQSGLHPGGLVNVVTRSGSNQWHGSAFEFLRNNYLNATSFFSAAKDTLHQNQFGGTFGGRIIRNKVFGFAGYQHEIQNQQQPNQTAYVPTAANLLGDFSATDPTIQLLDPLTGIALKGNKYAGTPGVTWSPNASALALVKLLPVTSDPTGKVTFAIPSQVTENQFVTRVDATLSTNNSLYGRYFLDGYQSLAFYNPQNILVTYTPGNQERAQGFTLAETYVLGKNLVNSAHATVTRRRDNRGPAATGINSSNIGINMYDMTTVGMQLSVTNKFNVYCGTCSAAHFNVNTLSLADDVNWMHGKHQVSFGMEWVQTELNVNNVYEGNGKFTFSGTYSQKGPAGTSKGSTGLDANLDFLTGSMSAFEQSKAQQNALREPIPSAYIQDTYHLNSRIVLSGGVRWDPEFVATDYFNRGSIFDYNRFVSNTVSTVYPNAPAGTFFYGDPGVPKAFTKNSPWQFSPRVGATFDPSGNGKTVFRVGGALVYDEPNLFTGQRVQQNAPFAQAVSTTPTGGVALSLTNPWALGTTTANPFPLPVVPTSSVKFQKGTQYFALPTKFHSPYMLQWTTSVQHEFARGWQAEVDYVGNQTVFGPYGLPMNPATYIPGSDCAGGTATPVHGTGTSACSSTGNYSARFALTLANPSQGPMYSGGGAGSVYILSGANASYHGLIASIQHRMSSNFVFLANYTWSHCIDISDNAADVAGITIQNPANIKGDKSSCGFDFRDIFNTTVVAASHFKSLNGLLGAAVNHWEISPLVHVTDGNPFTVTSGVDNSLIDVNNDRPNLTNPKVLYTHAKIVKPLPGAVYPQYINGAGINGTPVAFTQNATGTFGNSGRFAYRGPKFLQVDSALTRSFPLRETWALNLRIEAFNVLNHPDFAAPGSTAGYLGSSTALTSSTFGQVTAISSAYNARLFQGALKVTF